MRLRLKALVAADAKKPVPVDAATRAAVIALLGDAARTREQTDMVTNYARRDRPRDEREGLGRARARCSPPSTSR